jgi:RimJ/RimL family protein N-acetyltransferase
MLGPILKGRRVTLIPPRAEFIASWCRWFADVEVTRYLQKRFVPTPKAEAEWLEAQAKDRDSVLWSMLVGGKMIGSARPGGHRLPAHRHAASPALLRRPLA